MLKIFKILQNHFDNITVTKYHMPFCLHITKRKTVNLLFRHLTQCENGKLFDLN